LDVKCRGTSKRGYFIFGNRVDVYQPLAHVSHVP
jgi:hypothetical protein